MRNKKRARGVLTAKEMIRQHKAAVIGWYFRLAKATLIVAPDRSICHTEWSWIGVRALLPPGLTPEQAESAVALLVDDKVLNRRQPDKHRDQVSLRG